MRTLGAAFADPDPHGAVLARQHAGAAVKRSTSQVCNLEVRSHDFPGTLDFPFRGI